jgi:hypothetical protein
MTLDRLAFHRPPAPKPALRPVVLAYPACYIRPKFAANVSPACPLKILRDTFVRSPLALLSQIANRQSVSKGCLTPPEPFTSHSHESPVTFLPAPLFSYSYELLFPQALCFDNHPHCPGGVGVGASSCLPTFLCGLCVSVANPFFSYYCELFGIHKKLNSFAIKQIQTLSQKHGGYGIRRSSWQMPGQGHVARAVCHESRITGQESLVTSHGPQVTGHKSRLTTHVFAKTIATSIASSRTSTTANTPEPPP